MAEKTRCEECDRNFPNEDALAMHNSAKHSSSNEGKKGMSKKLIIIIAIIVVIAIGGFFFFNLYGKVGNNNAVNEVSQSNNVDSQNIVLANQDVQKITIGMNGNYNPNTITVKEGIPVEITLDNSVGGCYRNFNIPDLGVSQTSSGPSDTIKFTPSQKGTFGFRCGMGMGTGTIIVE